MSDKTTKERLAMIETKLENISEDIKNYIGRTDERIKHVEECKADKDSVERINIIVNEIKQDFKYFTRWAISILVAYVLGQVAINSDNIIKLFGG